MELECSELYLLADTGEERAYVRQELRDHIHAQSVGCNQRALCRA